MIPGKTLDLLGAQAVATARAKFDNDADYALLGKDLNDLRVLALRLEARMVDANELRDWQNRIDQMLSRAERIYE